MIKRLSEEHKKKISLAHMGIRIPHREETKMKISNTMKGRKPNNYGKKHSEEWKRKMSEIHKGHIGYSKGKKLNLTLKQRKARGDLIRGEKHFNWKGGISSINKKIRNSFEYKLWRNAVFERDNFTCIWCGQIGRKLHADHIKPFALFPELRFAIDNGRTLCITCHKKTNTYLKYYKKNKKEIQDQ